MRDPHFFDDCDILKNVCDGKDTGIYMAEKSLIFDEEYRTKIADSFTELFTNPEAQRLFRNYYRYGCDKGGDGR